MNSAGGKRRKERERERENTQGRTGLGQIQSICHVVRGEIEREREREREIQRISSVV